MGCQPPSHGLLQQRKPPGFTWLFLEAEQLRGDARLPPSVVLAMMRRASPLTYPYILRTRSSVMALGDSRWNPRPALESSFGEMLRSASLSFAEGPSRWLKRSSSRKRLSGSSQPVPRVPRQALPAPRLLSCRPRLRRHHQVCQARARWARQRSAGRLLPRQALQLERRRRLLRHGRVRCCCRVLALRGRRRQCR